MKNPLFAFLRAFISIFFIVVLLYIMNDKYTSIFRTLKGTSIPILTLGFAVSLCAIIIGSLRLKLIIAAQGIKIKSSEAVSLNLIGYFFNNFLPTSIGGDAVKAYYLYKRNDNKVASLTPIFVDRVVGLLTMICIAFLAIALIGQRKVNNAAVYPICGMMILSILFLIFIMNKKLAKKLYMCMPFLRPIEDKLKRTYYAINEYKYQKTLMAKAIQLSIAAQITSFLSTGIVALSIGAHIPAADLFLILPIISVLTLLPSINGLGLREGSIVLFFGPFIGKESAFALSILCLLILFITSLIGGIIYLVDPRFRAGFKGTHQADK